MPFGMAILGGYLVEWRGFRGYVGGSSTGLKPIHSPDSGADGNALLTTRPLLGGSTLVSTFS